ncbi:hypothetical protein [Lactobacillus johnsonii]|nr:hypothetical protein [Lactobacillus johnsonii]
MSKYTVETKLKVIEKLLSHEIFIPYYDTVKNKGLDMFGEIDWNEER